MVSCGAPKRHYPTGAGGEGEVATSGSGFTAGDGGTGAEGTLHSGGAGAVSMGGGDAGGSSGADASGATSGGQGTPACTAQQKLCDGVCVEIEDPTYGCDPTLCSAAGCPTTPGAALVCDAGQCLLGSCAAGSKKCNGQCVSITDPTYGCGATTCDASTCPSQGTGGTLVCTDSACVIGTCPTGYKKCGNKCVAITDPTYGCGATSCDATSCPAAGTGTLICQNGTCVIGACVTGTKKCGSNCVTTDANNGCADPARCTACASTEACSGTPTTCQCVPTPMATACAGKCGSVSNGCGGMYTCGACGGSTPNCVNNACVCTPTSMSTACSGKNCGTVSDGCTGSYTCGTCGGSTPNCVSNKCVCTPTPMSTACSGKSCGTVSDGCTGSYTCGTCSSTAPICLNSACKQCGSVADCPSGTFNCTNNTCVCRTPSSGNVIKDGGFDNASALNSWTSSGTVWSKSSDADACPGSGSITLSGGKISRCFQIPSVPAGGATYAFGMTYKAGSDSGAGCTGSTFQDAGCTQNGSLFFLSPADQSSTWTSSFLQTDAPEGTSSVHVECQTSSFLTIDQMFLRVAGFTGPAF